MASAHAHAGTYTARVRWQPSAGSDVVGYRLYVRTADAGYGAGQDVGLPPADPEGMLSSLVEPLDVRTDHVFAVAALAADDTESALSNEVTLGYAQVAALVDSDGDGLNDAEEDQNLNGVLDAGETDPEDADTDDDGVGDGSDQCQSTAGGEAVNASGCSCAQVTGDNGNACDGAEGCASGVCQPGTALSCSDGNVCTTDSCNAVTGCQYVAVANGTSCTDGNVCNGAETCQGGTCAAGTALSCSDGNVCTTDSCNAVTGCQHAAVANGTS